MPEPMSSHGPPSLGAWLRHQYRPGASYDTDPVATLAADALRLAGHRRLRTSADLVTLLRLQPLTPEVHAAAELAAARYARTVLAVLMAANTADPSAPTASASDHHQGAPTS